MHTVRVWDLISDYLYRVLASNDAGTGLSPWVYGKTKEGGTQNICHKKIYYYLFYITDAQPFYLVFMYTDGVTDQTIQSKNQ